jgi:HAE1 family hydrophobic/amphiphilic exporter-1
MTWMLMAALVLFGCLSFRWLGVSPLPDVDFPVVSVMLSLPGASADVMEAQVIDPIEDSLMQIEGIRDINSSSSQGGGSIGIEFQLGRDIDRALEEVQNRILRVRDKLPPIMEPPIVRKSNPEDQPVLWVVLTAPPSTPSMEVMSYGRNILRNQFSSVDGVADVVMGGYADPALRVSVDRDQLDRYNLTSQDLLNAIEREHVEMPVGRIEGPEHEYNVRLLGEATSPEDFSKILINARGDQPNFQPLRIGQFAHVVEDTAEVRRISRFNGRRSIGLGILKRRGSNAVQVAEAVRRKVETIQPGLPSGYRLDIHMDSTRPVRESIDELEWSLLLSALLASAVCLAFLGSWSSTFNVILSIPASIVGTFIALYFLGFTLNVFTLLGLSLAIGLVVDDSIMMLENIVRHRELGRSRLEAALAGAGEISFAAIAATIAVAAIFVPVVFMKGVIGRYFFQYGITITVAVLISLLVALTLMPMRCSSTRGETKSNRYQRAVNAAFAKLSRVYRATLGIALRARLLVLIAAVALFAASLKLATKLPQEMVPPQDASQILFRIWGQPGMAIGSTDAQFQVAEKFLSTQPEVQSLFSTVGGTGGESVNLGQIYVSLVPPSRRKDSQADLVQRYQKELRARLKEMRVVSEDISQRGFTAGRGYPIEFMILGPGQDPERLYALAKVAYKKLSEGKFAVDTHIETQGETTEYRLVPDRAKLAASGASLDDVTRAISALVGGVNLRGHAEYPKDGRRYEIDFRLISSQREQAEQLSRIHIRNNRGEVLPLSRFVAVEKNTALRSIYRHNRTRGIRLYANLAPGTSQKDALAKTEALVKPLLPGGFSFELTGGALVYGETMGSLKWALLLGVIVSYMVLASQLNSFVQPIAILLALPLGLSGAFASLAWRHQSLNIYSMIGLILLMGLSKKNSILLVDFANQVRARLAGSGKRREHVREALLEACPVRLRPILMTSFATVAGALPAALSLGPGSQTRICMAIAVIGGVIASTLLSLYIVPCAYSLLSALESEE